MNEIASLRARCEFAIRAPAHFAHTRQHICDGLLLAMMVNSGASARLDLEHAAQHRRFDAELRATQLGVPSRAFAVCPCRIHGGE